MTYLKDSKHEQEEYWEFEQACIERCLDGVTLYLENRFAGAIYLWGYFCEMKLKTAYLLYSNTEGSFLKVKNSLQTGVVTFNGKNLHDLSEWLVFLIDLRKLHNAPIDPAKAGALKLAVSAISSNWREYSRYRYTPAQKADADDVLRGIDEIDKNFDFLWRN